MADIGTWPADWTTRRIGQNVAGNRYVCPTLAPDPLDDGGPECTAATQCDRCMKWVCEDHADDDYHECGGGVFCRDCAAGCPEPFCQDGA